MDKERDRYWQNNRVSTERFIEVAANINDFVEEPVPPLVEEFAAAIAAMHRAQNVAMGVDWEVTPWDIKFSATHILQVLRMNGNCSSDVMYGGLVKWMPPNLLAVDKEQLKELHFAFPAIVRAGFPADFADEVERMWDNVLKYWGYKEDRPAKTVDEVLPIVEDISTAEQAKALVVDSAQAIITSLDWQWALGDEDLNEAQIAELFQAYFPRALTQMYIIPHIAVLAHDHDGADLDRLNEDQKIELSNNTSLVIPLGPISAKDANFLREAICIDVLEAISRHLGSDEAAGKLVMTNPALSQALMRSGLKSLGLSSEE